MKITKLTYTQRVTNQEDLHVEIETTDNIKTNLDNILEIKRFIDQLSVRINDENERKRQYVQCKNIVKMKGGPDISTINQAENQIKEYERNKNT